MNRSNRRSCWADDRNMVKMLVYVGNVGIGHKNNRTIHSFRLLLSNLLHYRINPKAVSV